METLRVLVCDDEMGMRLGIARALRGFSVEVPEFDGAVGFETVEAETGEAALEHIGNGAPDILLLDLKLPGISGLDVLDAIAEGKRDILTVMITAHASIETAVRATKQGAYDFLPKPFTPEELRNVVRKAARHFIIERQARKLAEEKRRVRFEFISVLAHELKAPINAVDGYLNILKDGTAGGDPKVLAQIVERCSVRIGGMRKMIGDLLDLTRIESGLKAREMGPVDLVEIARTAIETATPDAMDMEVSLALHAAGPVQLLADSGEIEIIFNNLVSNAVKYNRPGGRVDVSVDGADGRATVTVRDTGIGMNPDEAAMLFKDFVRIKNRKTVGILGSGLGLSILKKLVKLYQGKIDVKSAPDEGSTFTVQLHSALQTDSADPGLRGMCPVESSAIERIRGGRT